MEAQDKKLLTVLLLAEDEAQEQIEQEQEQRRAPSNAARPMFSHELSAQVRFADIEDDIDAAVEEATAILEGLHTEVREAVQRQVIGDADEVAPAEAQAAIHGLTSSQPEEIQESESRAALTIAGLLAVAYISGGRRLLEEATRQGVSVTSAPAEITAELFLPQAAAVAQHPWRRITGKIDSDLSSQDVLIRNSVTSEDVAGMLEQIKIDGSRDQAKQATQSSAGRGRIDTIDTATELEPAQIWASELMDGDQCVACETVDGRRFTDWEDARNFYPQGYYYRCAGGARCRGTLVCVFE